MDKLTPIVALLMASAGAMNVQAETAATTPAPQQHGGATAASPSATVSEQDRDFLKSAAQAGLAEVQASKIAVQKATDPAVKDFAQRMVDDHSKANEQLQKIASAKGVQVPIEPSLMQKGKIELLRASDGQDFNHRYMEAFGLNAHKDAVELFRKEVNEGKDRDVKNFAQATLPKLEQHLHMAQGYNAKAGPDAGDRSAVAERGSRGHGG